jgi:hypothetical protein
MMTVDDWSAEYITAKALATGQPPEEIIHALVHNAIEDSGPH